MLQFSASRASFQMPLCRNVSEPMAECQDMPGGSTHNFFRRSACTSKIAEYLQTSARWQLADEAMMCFVRTSNRRGKREPRKFSRCLAEAAEFTDAWGNNYGRFESEPVWGWSLLWRFGLAIIGLLYCTHLYTVQAFSVHPLCTAALGLVASGFAPVPGRRRAHRAAQHCHLLPSLTESSQFDLVSSTMLLAAAAAPASPETCKRRLRVHENRFSSSAHLAESCLAAQRLQERFRYFQALVDGSCNLAWKWIRQSKWRKAPACWTAPTLRRVALRRGGQL